MFAAASGDVDEAWTTEWLRDRVRPSGIDWATPTGRTSRRYTPDDDHSRRM